MARNRPDTRVAFVHASATTSKQDIGAQTIHRWHTKRGIWSERGRTGYHFIIRRSGLIELGRDLPAIGAHCYGFNTESIGICLVGGARRAKSGEIAEWDNLVSAENFTDEQYDSLEALMKLIRLVYPGIVFAPHNEVSNKACPGFDLWRWQELRFGFSDKLVAKKVLLEIQQAREEEVDNV